VLRDTTRRGLFVRVWPPHTTKTKDLTLVTRRGDCQYFFFGLVWQFVSEASIFGLVEKQRARPPDLLSATWLSVARQAEWRRAG